MLDKKSCFCVQREIWKCKILDTWHSKIFRDAGVVVVVNWPPLGEVCPNYEVVEFQPRTVTPPHIGSVDFRYILIQPFRPPVSSPVFWIVCFPLFPTASPYVAIHPQRPLFFHRLPTSSPGVKCHPPGSRLHPYPHPPPTSLRHSSLRPAPHACVCRRFLWCWAPPFSAHGLNPGHCQPLGGSPVTGPSVPMCPCLELHEFSSVMQVYDLYCSYGWIFFETSISRILEDTWIKIIDTKEVEVFVIRRWI